MLETVTAFMRNLAPRFFLALFALCLLYSCGEVVPIYSRTHEVPQYTLFFADQPVEFDINLDAPEPVLDVRTELMLRCDKSAVDREELPIMLILEGPDLELQEIPLSIPVMKDGVWLGEMDENEVDALVVYELPENLQLKSPARYSLKVYGNDEKQEQIFGVIEIGLRLYLYEPEEEDAE